MYNAFIGFSEYRHDNVKRFQGFDFETAGIFWHKVLAAYLGTDHESKIREVENKARIIGYTRLIRRSIRRNGLSTEEGRAEINLWTENLLELLRQYNTLLFASNELDIDARVENLPEVLSFIEKHLEGTDCTLAAQMQISVVAEEIFVNIARYAYAPEYGRAQVRVEVLEDPVTVILSFMDRGIPFDPLAKKDPDITLPAEERDIGGLGILMTKKMMDDVTYEYKDGQNILRVKKKL
jgi:anti-sigma regulatory factor (Ser/Thr protein kinase)